MPWSEARLWSAINRRQLGVRFRRQMPVGPYVVDFGCLDPRLVIEVDGPSHDWVDDDRRTSYLAREGFRVIRFNNEEIRDVLDAVCEDIRRAIEELRS
jgi:very-short-patch-repair endonuclease